MIRFLQSKLGFIDRFWILTAFIFILLFVASSSPVAAQSSNFKGQLGSMIIKDADGKIKGTTFRVWAPNAKSVTVMGTFNRWNKRLHPLKQEGNTGIWSADVARAKPGDEYMYVINGDLIRKDPRARKVVSSDGNSVIYDKDAFDWGETAKWQSSGALKDMVIYQLHPGTFFDPKPRDGEPGTLYDAAKKLDYLKDLGVNTILLMPVNEFSGRHSWGYNPSDQFAVESAYGGPDALKAFVKAAHERGISVHLDIVHNHYNPHGAGLWQFDGEGGGDTKGGIYFYEDSARGQTPWGPRPNFGRAQVRDFITDQVRMWFDEYKIDGLRWDSVVNIRAIDNGARTNPDGERMLQSISKMIRQSYPGKVNIAEDSVGDPRFDSSWEYDFHHGRGGGVVPQLIKRNDADRSIADIASRMTSKLGFKRVIYTENHDEVGKLNDKRRILTEVDENNPHSLLAKRKHALAGVITLTTPGIPLVFMGQELLEDKAFHDSNPLDWQRGSDAFHSFQLFKDLVHLRRNLEGRGAALTGTNIRIARPDKKNQLLVYRRYVSGQPKDDIFVVMNLSGEKVENRPITFPKAGEWNILINTDDPKYGKENTGVTTEKLRTDSSQKIAVSLAPYSAQIFGLIKLEKSNVNLEELEDEWNTEHGATEEVEMPPEEEFVYKEPEYDAVAFEANAKVLVVIANFTRPKPWDPNIKEMAMGLVDNHVWQANLSFINAKNIEFKIINPLTREAYGSTGFESHSLPVIGTAIEQGEAIKIAGPLNGDYSISFNDQTLRYRFEYRAKSLFGRMNVMGNFNSWDTNADPLYMIKDHTWEGIVEVDPNDEGLEFVFVADGSLEKQWGEDNPTYNDFPAKGTALEMAETIKITHPVSGIYRFTFNEETGDFVVESYDPDKLAPMPELPELKPSEEARHVISEEMEAEYKKLAAELAAKAEALKESVAADSTDISPHESEESLTPPDGVLDHGILPLEETKSKPAAPEELEDGILPLD